MSTENLKTNQIQNTVNQSDFGYYIERSLDKFSNAATDKPTFTFKKSDIYLSNLYRWDYPLDPQTVWTYYTKGNSAAKGGPNSKTRSSKMHMNINLQRDSRNYVYNVF